MKIVKFGLVLAFFTCFSLMANAQYYKTGIGIRGGISNGLTVKHFTSENTALEGILSGRPAGFIITGLYEVHDYAFGEPGFMWYYGGGAHIGSWSNRDYDGYVAIGIDGILGIEYTFEELPINISLDWKPLFNIVEYYGFWGDEFALSLRFAIK